MDSPLWTTAHAPSLEELPQAQARQQLSGAIDRPVNMLLHGPPGAGKTAAARAYAQQVHSDPEADLIELNVADFFDRTKAEIRDDPRFERFLSGQVEWTKGHSETKYKRDWSKREMINHVLKESASYAPSTGSFKTILLDNAEAIREDFQQALRRVMEQYHQSTQFIIATRKPTKLIPPLRSRCVAVPMIAPETETIATILERIVTAEAVKYEPDGLEFIAGYADGDLRKAILAAQTTAHTADEITMQTAYDALDDIGLDEQIKEMLTAAQAGEFTDARGVLDDLLVDEGLAPREVLEEILAVGGTNYDETTLAKLHRLVGEIDMALVDGNSGRIQIGQLLAEMQSLDDR